MLLGLVLCLLQGGDVFINISRTLQNLGKCVLLRRQVGNFFEICLYGRALLRESVEFALLLECELLDLAVNGCFFMLELIMTAPHIFEVLVA